MSRRSRSGEKWLPPQNGFAPEGDGMPELPCEMWRPTATYHDMGCGREVLPQTWLPNERHAATHGKETCAQDHGMEPVAEDADDDNAYMPCTSTLARMPRTCQVVKNGRSSWR